MKNYIFLTISMLIFSTALFGQINHFGTPFIKNYTRSEYQASEQNWSVCQDSRGVVYVGNNENGVLIFDGTEWQQVPNKNNSMIRSLAAADNGRVYVGGVSEFGLLRPDIRGNMIYESLSIQLDSINFRDVWRTYTEQDEVYFCTNTKIFHFKNDSLQNVFHNREGSFWSFKLGDDFYWGNYYDGLMKIEGDSARTIPGGNFYEEMNIFTILPFSDDEVFVGTFLSGAFLYNTKTGNSRSIDVLGENYRQVNQFLKNGQLYASAVLPNEDLVLGTLQDGLIIIDKSSGKIKYKLDKATGLNDLTITFIYINKDGNMWLGLNDGISFVETASPFSKFEQEDGFEGLIPTIIEYQGTTYFGTTTGLYKIEFNKENMPVFYKYPDLAYPTWDLFVYDAPDGKSMLLAGTSSGVYHVKQNSTELLTEENPYFTKEIIQSRFSEDTIFLAHQGGVAALIYKNGKWKDQDKYVPEIEQGRVERIVQDKQGVIWIGGSLDNIISYSHDDGMKFYDTTSGLPALTKKGAISYIDNQIYVSTSEGPYFFDREKNKFVYSDRFENFIPENASLSKIYKTDENNIWISCDREDFTEVLFNIHMSDSGLVNNSKPLRRLKDITLQDIYKTDEGYWIATSDALYYYRKAEDFKFNQKFYALNRRIIAGEELLFNGNFYEDTTTFRLSLKQSPNLKKTLDYKNNTVTFHFASPYFPKDGLVYSFKLDGYDVHWSDWIERDYKDYTNLSEGKYVFNVKAKNIYGQESEISNFEFYINPPWYRTLLAYTLYFILGILLIIVIVKLYTRRLEQEKIRLERIVAERTEEVVKQKEEIERQRDEISEKNKSITDSIEYASRIQTAVLPSDKLAEEILPEHFIFFRPRDIVSGDFYWMTKKEHYTVVIAADCTGHGVPGAFMSMLGVSFLNEIVNKHEITNANVILNQLRDDVKKTLSQTGKEGEAKDGMDIALCIIDEKNMKLQYAGAYNPLYLIRNKEMIQVKADRMPIGIYIKEKPSFTNHEMDIQKGDVFYIFSDGFQDQFGGTRGDKFKTRNFKDLLVEIHEESMEKQKQLLSKTIDDWKGEFEQVDDIIVIGVRV